MKVRKTKKIEKCGVGILHICRDAYVYSGEYFGEQKEIVDLLLLVLKNYAVEKNFQGLVDKIEKITGVRPQFYIADLLDKDSWEKVLNLSELKNLGYSSFNFFIFF